jgi:hypothetical protein
MLFKSLHQWWGESARDRRSRARRKAAPQRRVSRLDVLEDRTLLSTLLVKSAADDGSAGTLRAVLAAAHSGDTIQFARALDGQTITLTQGQLVVNQGVTIDGPGASELAISGNSASRLFEIGSGGKVTISGLTLTDGIATDGAAVLNAGNLTLSQDVLSADVAQGVAGGGLFGDGAGRGGAVENEAGATLTVSQSAFTGDLALGGTGGGNAFGGAIENEAGTVTIDHSTFTGDQAVAASGGVVGVAVTLPGGVSASLLGVAGGGGVWNDGGALCVTNSTLTDNLAQGGSNGNASGSTAAYVVVGTAIGGAIGESAFFTAATPSLVVGNSTFTGNQSLGGSSLLYSVSNAYPPYPADAGSGRGGALGAVAGNVSISQSALNGNTAQGGNLATDVLNGITVILQGSSGFGGGIDDEFDFGFQAPQAATTLTINGTTIASNAALGSGPSGAGNGGGVASAQVNASVTDSIVEGNHATGSFLRRPLRNHFRDFRDFFVPPRGRVGCRRWVVLPIWRTDDQLQRRGRQSRPGRPGRNHIWRRSRRWRSRLRCAAGPVQRDLGRESGDRRHVKCTVGRRRSRWRFRRRRALLRCGDDHQHRFRG